MPVGFQPLSQGGPAQLQERSYLNGPFHHHPLSSFTLSWDPLAKTGP